MGEFWLKIRLIFRLIFGTILISGRARVTLGGPTPSGRNFTRREALGLPSGGPYPLGQEFLLGKRGNSALGLVS